MTVTPSGGDVAQLVEHLLCKQEVVGSSPVVSTISVTSTTLPQDCMVRSRGGHSARRTAHDVMRLSQSAHADPSTCSLTSRVGGTRSSRISSENQIKLERVYVWMPRHQEPTKDVAKLRNAPERRKQSLTRGCPRFGNDTV